MYRDVVQWSKIRHRILVSKFHRKSSSSSFVGDDKRIPHDGGLARPMS
jgi:hypothetical protein